MTTTAAAATTTTAAPSFLDLPQATVSYSDMFGAAGGPAPRSPYHAPVDDSDDDGASDYAANTKRHYTKAWSSHPTTTTAMDNDDDSPQADSAGASSDNLLQRFYETTVDAPCRQVACAGGLEEQLDLFMHCRRPSQFLSFFQEHASPEAVGVEVLPAGAYVLPTFCEYCHAAHVSSCRPGVCRRPGLYFQKKRPPFAPPDPAMWDATTDEYVPPPPATTPTTPQAATSWLSMFSHSDGGD